MCSLRIWAPSIYWSIRINVYEFESTLSSRTPLQDSHTIFRINVCCISLDNLFLANIHDKCILSEACTYCCILSSDPPLSFLEMSSAQIEVTEKTTVKVEDGIQKLSSISCSLLWDGRVLEHHENTWRISSISCISSSSDSLPKLWPMESYEGNILWESQFARWDTEYYPKSLMRDCFYK